MERYSEYVDRMDRKRTRQSYSSKVNILKDFIAVQTNPIKYAYQFDVTFCTDFIDWIFLDRESSPRTRNNYRGWLYSLAEFLIARKHIKTNPVEHIRVMRIELSIGRASSEGRYEPTFILLLFD